MKNPKLTRYPSLPRPSASRQTLTSGRASFMFEPTP